jgi:hypothetical protein
MSADKIQTGKPLPKLASVSCADAIRHHLSVRWRSGPRANRIETVDLSPLVGSLKFYAPLRKNAALFSTVHLTRGGSAIAWGENDEIDMAASSVQRLAAQTMTGADFRAFLFRNNLTQDAAAACLGRSKRSIAGYVEMDWIPRVIVLACKGWESSIAMDDEVMQRYVHGGYFVADGGTVSYEEYDPFGSFAPAVPEVVANEKRKVG